MSRSVADCGSTEHDILITIARPTYDNSVYAYNIQHKMMAPKIRSYYWTFWGLYMILITVLSIAGGLMLRYWIIKPIGILS